MTKKKQIFPAARRILNKRLDGSWTWTSYIWFTDKYFADCTISSGDFGPNFNDENSARENMENILRKLKIRHLT